MTSFVIIDDHELTRRGIREVLSAVSDFAILGEAANGTEGLRLIESLKPDVALLDVRMPGLQGPAICQIVSELGLPTLCIILTGFTDDQLLHAALSSGARGYIIKDVTSDELIHQIRTIVHGGTGLDPRIAGTVVRWIKDLPARPPHNFSTVDIKILSLVAGGFTNKEIGDSLNFSENTVKAHLNAIIAQLQAKNRVEAAVIAYRQGLI